MSGPTEDSMNRYHVQQDLYSVQSTPDATRIRQQSASGMSNKDTLRSQQLEKELFNRYQSNGVVVLVAQVGKYLFLAIMLPPYLFAYSIPKWLLLEAAPALFEQINKGAQFLFRGILDFAFAALAPFKLAQKKLKILQQKIQTHLKAFADKFHSALTAFGKKIQEFANSIYQTLSKLVSIPKQGIEALTQALNRFQEALTSQMKKAQEALKNGWSSAGNALKKGWERVAKPIVEFSKKVEEKLEKAVEKVKAFAAKLAQPVVKAYNKVAQVVQNTFHAIADPLVGWFAPKFQAAKEKITYSLEALAEKLAALQQMAANAVRPFKEIPAALLNLLAMPKQLGQMGEKIGLSIVQIYKNIKEMLKAIPKTFKTIKDRVKEGLKSLVKQAKEFGEKGKKWARKGAAWSVEKGKLAASLIKKALLLIGRGIGWIFYSIQILIACIIILLRLGMRLVKHHGQFTFKSTKFFK